VGKSAIDLYISNNLSNNFTIEIDIHDDFSQMANHGNKTIRREIAKYLGKNFKNLANKNQGWEALHKLASDIDVYARYEAICSLGIIFEHIPNKISAWRDIDQSSRDKNEIIRCASAFSIGHIFDELTKLDREIFEPIINKDSKNPAFEDLIRLSEDIDLNVRYEANSSLQKVLYLECPQCKLHIRMHSSYCPNCGKEFGLDHEQEVAFSYAFDEMDNAYKPSGKGSIKGFLLALLIGIPLSGIGAFFVYSMIYWLSIGRTYLPLDKSSFYVIAFGIITAFLLLGASVLVGEVIGLGLKKILIYAENRNEKQAIFVGLICGIFCFSFLFILDHNTIWGYSIGTLDEWIADALTSQFELGGYWAFLMEILLNIGSIRLIIIWAMIASAIILIPIRSSLGAVLNTPYCDNCKVYMTKLIYGKLPIKYEKELMAILVAHDFRRLVSFIPTAAELSTFSILEFYVCDKCKAHGYLNVKTIQTRDFSRRDGSYKGKFITKRQIFSSKLNENDLEKLDYNLFSK
jgi:hypothetical protein